MRKFYCDYDKKEVTQDAATKAIDLHPVFLILQEQDLATGKLLTHAIWTKELCGLHKDLVIEEGHLAIKEFEKKVDEMAKKGSK